MNRLPLLAYRPLGGRKSKPRTAVDPVLGAIAAQHGATPFEIALAWLRDLADGIVPLPGVTRVVDHGNYQELQVSRGTVSSP